MELDFLTRLNTGCKRLGPDESRFDKQTKGMIYVLKVLEGRQTGVSLLLGSTLMIGRTSGDFLIQDSKASGAHAKLTWDGKNYIIEDLGSSNGTRVNGHLIERGRLEVGHTFKIGQTLLQLATQTPEKSANSETEHTENSPEPPPPPATWQNQTLEYIKTWLPEPGNTFSSHPPPTLAKVFEKPLRLYVKRGQNYDSEFLIKWGPRTLTDQHQLDLTLLDIEVSPLLLTLTPKKGGALLVATHPEAVAVNGKVGKQFSLISGDEIAFGQTLITVSFEEHTNE